MRTLLPLGVLGPWCGHLRPLVATVGARWVFCGCVDGWTLASRVVPGLGPFERRVIAPRTPFDAKGTVGVGLGVILRHRERRKPA